MKKLTNKSGFTLIEIIVVLIIVGILASIALPNLFSNIVKAKGEEALASISSWRPSVEACIQAHPAAEANCAVGGANAVALPASTSFTYAAAFAITNGFTDYGITASGVAAQGVPVADTITIARGAVKTNATNAYGAVTCTSTFGAC